MRYDPANEQQPKVRSADFPDNLARAAPLFSEFVVHAPDDPTTYIPENLGPSITLSVVREDQHIPYVTLHPSIYVPKALPTEFPTQVPPARPPVLAWITKDLHVQLVGEIKPSNTPKGAVAPPTEQFITHAIASLPVGWLGIEIYPRLDPDYWKSEYAAAWARLDLLGAIAQRNALESALQQLDGRGAAREHYVKLLQEFEALLEGPEEPCHQYLKAHPEIICPTHDAYWSKLAFGDHVSDFVFREPYNDYVLVEIEAPHRQLFRKDGHPRQMLTHAISQIGDWIKYIQDNKNRVDDEMGLTGISMTPRALVIIGRSVSLTDKNRRSLVAIQGSQPRLTILTYDDLLQRARSELERLFGPLLVQPSGAKIYFFRSKS